MIRPRIDPALVLILLLAGLFYGRFTHEAPYHIDTVGYVEAAKTALATGTPPRATESRFLNAYWYIPFLWVAHEQGIKALSVSLVLAFSLFYYLVVRREWGRHVAITASLMLLTTPAAVITVTHLKEDFAGLLLLVVALWILGRDASLPRVAFGAFLYGLACLTKEIPLILLPFMVVHTVLARGRPTRWRDWMNAGWLRRPAAGAALLVGVATATVGIVSPRHLSYLKSATLSIYQGQFLGVGSSGQTFGARLWQEGMLHLAPLHLLLVVALIRAARRREFTTLLWLTCAVWTFLFISNTSVVRGRLFLVTAFFTAPLIASAALQGLERLFERRGGTSAATPGIHQAAARKRRSERVEPPLPAWRRPSALLLQGGTIVLALFQLGHLLPTLRYRLAYPPQASFYGGLRDRLAPGALMVGVDNCVLARYYCGRPCLVAPVDVDTAGARVFADALMESLATRPVYLLPDAFSYDTWGHRRREIRKRFDMVPAYSGFGENYHGMAYGRPLRELRRQVERDNPACSVASIDLGPVLINDRLTLQRRRLRLLCGDREGERDVLTYAGFQTFLDSLTVYRLEAARRVPNGPPADRGGP